MMMPQNYAWLPDRDRPGVELKHLGTFTEMRTGIGFFRLLPGARLEATRQRDAELRYCIDGAFTYGGKDWGKDTYLYLPPESAPEALASADGATFFTITLPMIAECAARQRDGARAAAE